MVGLCAAPGCRNETPNPNISYFHFPNRKKYPESYQAWSEAITQRYPEFKVTYKSKICELHFTEEDYDDSYKLKKVLMTGHYFRPILKKDAIPKFNYEPEVGNEPEKQVLEDCLGWKGTKTEEIRFEEVNLKIENDETEASSRIFTSTTDYILNKPLKPLPAALQKIIPSILSVIIKADNCKVGKFTPNKATGVFSCSALVEPCCCKFCNFSTSLKIDLDKHLKIAHRPIKIAGTIKRPPMKIHRFKEPKQYACIKCNFSTYSLLVLLKHVNNATRKHHLLQEVGTRWYRCHMCPYKTSTNSNVKKHLWDKHRPKMKELESFECEHCDFFTEKEKNLRKHLIRKHAYKKNNFFQCKHCFYQSSYLDMLWKHQKDKHSRENYQFFCDICDYCSEYKHNMARHILTKHSNQFLECKLCNFKTTYKLAFKSHMKKWHGK